MYDVIISTTNQLLFFYQCYLYCNVLTWLVRYMKSCIVGTFLNLTLDKALFKWRSKKAIGLFNGGTFYYFLVRIFPRSTWRGGRIKVYIFTAKWAAVYATHCLPYTSSLLLVPPWWLNPSINNIITPFWLLPVFLPRQGPPAIFQYMHTGEDL